MITIIGGLPGTGKSLYAVDRIAAEAEKDKRPVFYAGIRDCRVPGWTLIAPDANALVEDRSGAYYKPEGVAAARRWPECPPNSIVVIDEAHEVFPQRAAGSLVPAYVQAMAVHRGMGLDVVLLTQDGGSLDHFIRRRCGRYLHLWRSFGRSGAMVWEFAKWCDWEDRDARRGATQHHFAYSRRSFELYKSAEVHTVKRRLPVKLLVIPALAALAVGAVVLAYQTFFGADSQARKATAALVAKGNDAVNNPTASLGGGGRTLTTRQYVAERIPRLPDLPESAPVYDDIAKPKTFPRVTGCVQSARGCSCYTQQGTRLQDVSKALCEGFVKHGAFDPYTLPVAAPAFTLRAQPVPPDGPQALVPQQARSESKGGQAAPSDAASTPLPAEPPFSTDPAQPRPNAIRANAQRQKASR